MSTVSINKPYTYVLHFFNLQYFLILSTHQGKNTNNEEFTIYNDKDLPKNHMNNYYYKIIK